MNIAEKLCSYYCVSSCQKRRAYTKICKITVLAMPSFGGRRQTCYRQRQAYCFVTGSSRRRMVLLKNNRILPLAKRAKIVLFGQASVNYIKGGGGSGHVYCLYISVF